MDGQSVQDAPGFMLDDIWGGIQPQDAEYDEAGVKCSYYVTIKAKNFSKG